MIETSKNEHYNSRLNRVPLLEPGLILFEPVCWVDSVARPADTSKIEISCDSGLIRQYLYVVDRDKKKKRKTEKKDQEKRKKERYLLCKQCEHKISKPDYRLKIQGAFDHTFLNPTGQVFQIGCFERADGCVVIGEASSEWTWFQGFHWRVALCGQCLKHLGWFYFNEHESSFFGLILDALV